MTRKISCTTPHGVFTRRTHRTYTHAVVQRIVKGQDGGERPARVLSWCGSAALADTQLRYWIRQGIPAPFMAVFPIDQERA